MKLNNKPKCATWKEWKTWEKETQEKYPIRYFLLETIPTEFIYIKSRVRDFYWSIVHRVCPKHKYYLINTKLKPGYYDLDTRLEHGVFSLLEDFVEHQDWKSTMDFIYELRDIQNKYNSLPEGEEKNNLKYQLPGINQLEHYIEADIIYKWWKQFKNKEDLHDKLPVPNIKEMFDPTEEERKVLKEWDDKIREEEQQDTNKVDEMLIRLINIRKSLWN